MILTLSFALVVQANPELRQAPAVAGMRDVGLAKPSLLDVGAEQASGSKEAMAQFLTIDAARRASNSTDDDTEEHVWGSAGEAGARLWRHLRPFARPLPGGAVVTAAALDEAYATQDDQGQDMRTVAFPDRKVLLRDVDADGDGSLSEAEARAWQGLGKRACENHADMQYDCTQRCTAGHDRPNGFGTYYTSKYRTVELPEPEGLWRKLDDGANNWGAVSTAQGGVLERALFRVLSQKVPGAIAEFGVFRGGTSSRLANLLSQANVLRPSNCSYDGCQAPEERELHYYDSFEGLPACDHGKDKGMCMEGAMDETMEMFVEKSKDWGYPTSQIKVHKGYFSDIQQHELPEKIAFAFLDGDLYGSIKDSLDKIYPRLSKGAVVLVHDFGWEGYPGTELALADALGGEGRPEHPVLPTFRGAQQPAPALKLKSYLDRALDDSDPAGASKFACYIGMIIKE